MFFSKDKKEIKQEENLLDNNKEKNIEQNID